MSTRQMEVKIPTLSQTTREGWGTLAPISLHVSGEDFQDDRGDVVVRRGAVGEGLEAVEEVIEGFGGGLGRALRPEFGHTIGAELGAFGVAGFVQAVGGEKNGVSGREWDDVLVIDGGVEEAGRESTLAEGLAGGRGGVERVGQAGIGKGQRPRGRVEDRVERRAKAAVQGTLQETLVEK